MVERNLLLAAPLEKIKPIQYTKEFRLYLTDQEKKDFRYYMEKEDRFRAPCIPNRSHHQAPP